MKVKVTFKGGEVINFVVNKDITVISFIQLATEAGGEIDYVEFE